MQGNVLGRKVRRKVEGKWKVITETGYLSAEQINSAKILLNKIVPDLTRVVVQDGGEAPKQDRAVRFV